MALVKQDEGYIGHAVLLEMLDVFAMNGRSIGAGIHLGFYAFQAKLGKIDRFQPADNLLSPFRFLHRYFLSEKTRGENNRVFGAGFIIYRLIFLLHALQQFQ